MIIKTTKHFDKQYAKLSPKLKQQFNTRLTVFVRDPFDVALRNHALKGRYLGYRSIDIGGDVRAIYTTRGELIIIFGFIGTHSQLY
jgi:addiction module RelE/StbE family toxin